MRSTPLIWGAAVLALALGYFAFRDGVDLSARWIWDRPEYSHGLLIPFVAAFLVWQRRDRLAAIPFQGSSWGVAFLLLAVALNFVGQLGSLFIVQQYAAVVAVYGLVLALVGIQAFRPLWMPLLILLFMVPLPEFLYQNLSAQLQLISSKIGVAVIRLFGISVFLEGNVIDLGSYKLQVAEACSGLRYLFPLMTLGFVMAYFFQAALWKRLLLFASSIPITVLLNSFRIGVIGVLVNSYGISQAEGFLHDFEGWVIFMASAGVMLLEIVILSKVGRDARPWREIFGIELPARRDPDTTAPRPVPATFVVACGALAVAALAAHFLPERADRIPARETFASFPKQIGPLTGRFEPMDKIYLDQLKLDDYLMVNYGGDGKLPINLYVAWYDTQRAGRSTHSPRTCLPGGGWRIESFDQVDVPKLKLGESQVRVNRAVIALGDDRQLVYYFFKQRQRVITNEYVVKLYLMWDALTQHRTDGALVRLVMPLPAGTSPADGDARLQGFLASAAPRLSAFVPN